MKIIMISGKMRHGKDTCAQFIKEELERMDKRILIIHYADYLKFILKQYFGWDGEKNEEGRKLLQIVGTDLIRARQPDFWVDIVAKFLLVTHDQWDYVLIPDTRFPNEITKMKMMFGIQNTFSLRVDRVDFVPEEATKEQLAHPSETALDGYEFDNYIFNTGDLNALREKIQTYVKTLT